MTAPRVSPTRREAVDRQRRGLEFAGLIYGHQTNVSIRQCVDDLELMALVMDPAEVRGQVFYLPVK